MKPLEFAALVVAMTLAFSLGWWGRGQEERKKGAAVTYEVQICRDGQWSPSYDAAALTSEWVTVDAGTCGVRWRDVTP